MISKRKVSEIRANLLKACAEAEIDPAVWFDEEIRKAKSAEPQNVVEIETLKLVRDGLRATATRKSRKRTVTRQ